MFKKRIKKSRGAVNLSVLLIQKAERIVAFFMLLMIVTSVILPTSKMFGETESNPEEQKEAEIYDGEDFDLEYVPVSHENESLRGYSEKVFKKVDGTYEYAVYDDVIHYMKDGKYIDIDNTIYYDEKTDSYRNKDNSYSLNLPSKLNSKNYIEYKEDEYSIKWKVNDEKVNSSLKIVLKETSDLLVKNDLRTLNNLHSSIIYNDIDKNVDLEYILYGNKVKENIILNEYIEKYSISFEYILDNLILKQDENKEYVFANEKGEPLYKFDNLYMEDSKGNLLLPLRAS